MPKAKRQAAPPPPVRPEPDSHVQQAHARIEEMIITGELAPGQIVSESGLAQAIGFGRTPVREALQRLSREGLVAILPKRGVTIAHIDFGRQLRMLEFRRVVEGFMVAAAARRATAEQRQTFRQLSENLADAAERKDGAAFLALDVRFSEELAAAARNEFASGAMTLMHGLSRRFGYIHDAQGSSLPRMARFHAALADAIAAGDEAAAVRRLDELMESVEQFTRGALELP